MENINISTVPVQEQVLFEPPKPNLENSSGLKENSVVPNEIKGWSWGGFFLGPFWAIGNKTWIGLLSFIPYLGFIMNIILGIKGNEWSWKNKKWTSVEQFKKVQKIWAIWGLIIPICLVVIGIFFSLSSYNNMSKRAQKAIELNNQRNAELQLQMEKNIQPLE